MSSVTCPKLIFLNICPTCGLPHLSQMAVVAPLRLLKPKPLNLSLSSLLFSPQVDSIRKSDSNFQLYL